MFKAGQLIRTIILDSASLLTSIQQGQATDPLSAGHISRLESGEQAVVPPNAKPDPWSLGEDGKMLLYKQCTYVPDHNDIHLDILHSLHDHQLAGHPGIGKTMKSICRQYHWPHMSTFVTDYIRSCSKCRHAKSIHHKPFRPLRFLPIGERPWDSISMDFIEGLPLSDGHDMILVIVDRLTKMALFIPTYSDIDSGEVAMLFLRYVFAKHGTPSDIISDRGKHFTSRFWTSLCEILGIKGNLSTVYHPQTDGQTERVNQIL
jgi:Integrase zinc binding domain/Integrase core domain